MSRRSTVAPFLQPALSAPSAVRPAASSHLEVFLFWPSSSRSPGTRPASTTEEDTAGLAAERAFDNRLLEKRTVLEAAAACAEVTVDRCSLRMQPSARPVYPRAWKPRSACSSGRAACHRAWHPSPHACGACLGPSAAPGSAEMAAPRHAGSLSSESHVPTLQRLVTVHGGCCPSPHLRVHCIDSAAAGGCGYSTRYST